MSTSGGVQPVITDTGGDIVGVVATSGNQANATATATLPGSAGKTTFITGFDITAAGATTGLVVLITVTGILTPLSYVFAVPAGALLGATPFQAYFPAPIPASTPNAGIVVALPALGLGNTNAVVTAYGYQA